MWAGMILSAAMNKENKENIFNNSNDGNNNNISITIYIALTQLQSDSPNKNKEQNNTNNKKPNDYRNVKRQRNYKHSERPTTKGRLNGS